MHGFRTTIPHLSRSDVNTSGARKTFTFRSPEATEDKVSISNSKAHTCDLIGLDFLRVQRGRE